MTQDLRLAVRLLVKHGRFTAAVVLVLALGIGATTIVFTIINGWNLQDLPVDEPDRIVHLATRDPQGRRRNVSYLDFLDWQRTARSFSGLAAYSGTSASLTVEGRPAERLAATFISWNGFDVLRVRPILGRGFRPEDDRGGAERVVLLGQGVWSDRFGSDPSIVGRVARVDGAPATIVGVMPAGFRFPVQAEIWQPIAQRPGIETEPRDARTVGVYGRLADDVPIAQARAELEAVTATLAKEFPASNRGFAGSVLPFTEYYLGRITEGPPLILMTAVGLVLLIACANAANLLLARAVHRAREVALRRALGASRWRIVRQLLAESLLLATLAGLFGLVLAWPVVRIFAAETADFNMPYWTRLAFDLRVFGFVAAVCGGTAVLFGLAPAWKLARVRAGEVLEHRGGALAGGALRSRRLTSGLLVAQLALSVVLLTGAGLLIRSALVLYEADRAIDAANILIARISLPSEKYGTPQQQSALYDRLEERLASIPSVESASIATASPFFGAGARELVLEPTSAQGDVASALPAARPAAIVAIGAGYHETLRLSLRRGREFDGRDREAALVNERFVALFMPGQDPIGRRLRFKDDAAPGAAPPSAAPLWFTIVGVAPNIRHSPASNAAPAVYLPLRAQPTNALVVLARGARGRQASLAADMREALRTLDADLALYNISTLERLSQQSRWTHRAASSMLSLFAACAMLLAAIGLYAVTAYAVSQRTSEIGIRIALGAQRSQVSWLFLRETFARLGLGLTIGVAGAIALGQLLRGVLVDTRPLEPLTLTVAVVLLAIAGTAAGLVPARRASLLDPAVALRHD